LRCVNTKNVGGVTVPVWVSVMSGVLVYIREWRRWWRQQQCRGRDSEVRWWWCGDHCWRQVYVTRQRLLRYSVTHFRSRDRRQWTRSHGLVHHTQRRSVSLLVSVTLHPASLSSVYQTFMFLIIRLEAGLQPNIWNTLRPVLMVFTPSGISWMKSGAL